MIILWSVLFLPFIIISILASSLSAQWHLYTLLTWFPCPTYIIFITIIIITSFWICSRDLPNRRKYSGKLLILLRPKLKIWSKKNCPCPHISSAIWLTSERNVSAIWALLSEKFSPIFLQHLANLFMRWL